MSGGRIPVVGIVGGIGSGKSTLAQWVAEHYPVVAIDADRLGHRALERPEIIQQLRVAFGDDILNAQGKIERSLLAHRVFGDSPVHEANRHRLEQIVHPEIQREIERQIAELNPAAVCCVLLDAAVLLESGWDHFCDVLVFVDTPEDQRMRWVTQRRGWTAQELARRAASQWPLERKRAVAQAVVVNDGPVEQGGERLWRVLQQFFPDRCASPLPGAAAT